MTKKTLLQKAHKAKTYTRGADITGEHIRLAMSWAEGRLTHRQVCEALGVKGMQPYTILARGLREAVQRGKYIKPKRGNK